MCVYTYIWIYSVSYWVFKRKGTKQNNQTNDNHITPFQQLWWSNQKMVFVLTVYSFLILTRICTIRISLKSPDAGIRPSWEEAFWSFFIETAWWLLTNFFREENRWASEMQPSVHLFSSEGDKGLLSNRYFFAVLPLWDLAFWPE